MDLGFIEFMVLPITGVLVYRSLHGSGFELFPLLFGLRLGVLVRLPLPFVFGRLLALDLGRKASDVTGRCVKSAKMDNMIKLLKVWPHT